MLRFLMTCALIVSPVAALAAGEMAVVSEMFVEKTVVVAGKPKAVLVKQKSGPPGTRLVFTHSYRNASAKPVPNFGMTNPMPAGVEYTGSDDANASVSVDGGNSWGALAALKVRGANGALRPAQPDDVTHVRWKVPAVLAPGAAGKFSFRGVVK